MNEPLPHHLGGHKNRTHTDEGVLRFARDELGVKSMLDIGCGPGGQVYKAIEMGIDARGIDGDHTLVRDKPELFELHDFTKGKFDPNTKVIIHIFISSNLSTMKITKLYLNNIQMIVYLKMKYLIVENMVKDLIVED
jgi:hypothetical protein